jgi:transcriptional regulator with XRE-family HTH domain
MSRKAIVIIIKNRRIDAGLTQKQLADKIGMSEKTYQRIESGVMDMRFSQYYAIIAALGATDLDIVLDSFDVDTATPWDVAAAARLLLPETRRNLVASIMAEWQRAEHQFNADIDLKGKG